MCVFLGHLAFFGRYFESLGHAIKRSLKNRNGIEVRISLPFHELAFERLKEAGYLVQKGRRCERYSLKKLQDLDHLLGKGWYVRMRNKWGDFSYCHLGTLNFYLRQLKPISETLFDGTERKTEGGFVLVFSCVRMDAGSKEVLEELFPELSVQ